MEKIPAFMQEERRKLKVHTCACPSPLDDKITATRLTELEFMLPPPTVSGPG